jgi:hypothetical protein
MSFGRSRRDIQFARPQTTSPRVYPLRATSPETTTPPRSPEKRYQLPSSLVELKKRREERLNGRLSGTFAYQNPFFRLVGETSHGKPTGYGVVYLADGGMTEGNFDADGELTCPEGCRRWPDGSTYSGPLLKGEAHGVGRLVSSNGDHYVGDFACGYKSGSGQLENRASQLQYTGEFRTGAFHGEGCLKTPAVVCTGFFAHGKPHGTVTMEFENGDRFVGTARDGLPHGEAGTGCFTSFATGVTYYGAMRDGARETIANALVPTEVFLNGSAYPSVPTAVAPRKSPSPTGSLRLSKSKLPLSLSRITKPTPPIEMPRYIDQLQSTQERFVTVPFNKPLRIQVTFAIRSESRVPSQSAPKRPAKGAFVATVIKQLETSETGRRVRLTVYQFPDSITVDGIPSYHERARPSPVALVPQDEAADFTSQLSVGTLASGTFAYSEANISPAQTPLAGTLSRVGTVRLPPVKAGPSSPKSKSPAASLLPLVDRTRATAAALLSLTHNGVASFDVKLLDPGSYYLRFDVPEEHQAVQHRPGEQPDGLARRALSSAVGYMPLRLIRQC